VNGHVDSEMLVAYADGSLDAARASTVRDHVAGCRECRNQLDDLEALERLVDHSDEDSTASGSGGVPASLDCAFDQVIDQHVREPVSRFRSWRKALIPIALAAGLAGVWLLVRDSTARPPALGLRGAALLARETAAVRGAGDTLHFEISLDAPSHVAIFKLAGAAIELYYPHPNPVLGTFGRTTPFEAAVAHRIPPTAVADYPAPASRPEAFFFAVPTRDLASAESLAPVLTELRAAAASGPDAVRDRLRARFGAVADLPRR
jgi:hypothetical protein